MIDTRSMTSFFERPVEFDANFDVKIGLKLAFHLSASLNSVTVPDQGEFTVDSLDIFKFDQASIIILLYQHRNYLPVPSFYSRKSFETISNHKSRPTTLTLEKMQSCQI